MKDQTNEKHPHVSARTLLFISLFDEQFREQIAYQRMADKARLFPLLDKKFAIIDFARSLKRAVDGQVCRKLDRLNQQPQP